MNISSATRRHWSISAALTTMQPKPGWPGPTPPAPAPPVPGGPPEAWTPSGGQGRRRQPRFHSRGVSGDDDAAPQAPLHGLSPLPGPGRRLQYLAHSSFPSKTRFHKERLWGGGRGAASNPGAVPKNQRGAGAGSSAPCPPYQAVFPPRSLGVAGLGGREWGGDRSQLSFRTQCNCIR